MGLTTPTQWRTRSTTPPRSTGRVGAHAGPPIAAASVKVCSAGVFSLPGVVFRRLLVVIRPDTQLEADYAVVGVDRDRFEPSVGCADRLGELVDSLRFEIAGFDEICAIRVDLEVDSALEIDVSQVPQARLKTTRHTSH